MMEEIRGTPIILDKSERVSDGAGLVPRAKAVDFPFSPCGRRGPRSDRMRVGRFQRPTVLRQKEKHKPPLPEPPADRMVVFPGTGTQEQRKGVLFFLA
jgi:hypothetical protein